jgi:excisionase family DNA binding protein
MATAEGGQQIMTDDVQETRRYQLLGVLFGTEVPEALQGHLLRTSDVATLFQVSERTVSEWAKRGQIPSVRTPGGHRRYPADGIRALLQEGRPGAADDGPSRAGASVTELSDRRPITA